jgi:lysyl-tRNA synthetase class 2
MKNNKPGQSLHKRCTDNPDLFEVINKRSKVITAIRNFFDQRGFIEVDTPSLVIAPDPAIYLDSFSTDFCMPYSDPARLYLRTSPEYHMKRMVAAGFENIYQIGPFFRNAEMTVLHNPEFTGLEWYQTSSTVEESIELTEQLIGYVAEHVLEKTIIERDGSTIELKAPYRRMTFRNALFDLAQVHIPGEFDLKTIRDALEEARISYDQGDSVDDLLNRVVVEKIDPALKTMGATFVYDYPAPLAALARLRKNDPTVAERYELYIGGMELCNGYGELTDPVEQRQRFEAQVRQRQEMGKDELPIDEAFLIALEEGMPACAGCALGVDRLIMLLLGKDRIEDVMAFPLSLELERPKGK